ncbi:PRA1 family protein 3 [Portunus trituberculatus]|uniref:PRA1 family protein 3 n=1 Tax=Portunus trituberculatus TaxID=210409 RepID=A0A5B7HHP5_PORTR|nr:PRA1 family protein 3 [Portunus trituberculatus]
MDAISRQEVALTLKFLGSISWQPMSTFRRATNFVDAILRRVIHPTKMFCGMTAVGLAFGLFYYMTNSKQPAAEFKKNHPVLSLLAIVLGAYFVVYLLGSVVVFLMGILLPITEQHLHTLMKI